MQKCGPADCSTTPRTLERRLEATTEDHRRTVGDIQAQRDAANSSAVEMQRLQRAAAAATEEVS